MLFCGPQEVNAILQKIAGGNASDADKYHLGKIMYNNMSRFPDILHQVDIITGESETNSQVLNRVRKFVKIMLKVGIKKGDVIAIIAPNNMDVCIPFIGSLMLGSIAFPMDANLKSGDIKHLISIGQPKAIFCQDTTIAHVQSAISDFETKPLLYSFGNTDNPGVTMFSDLLKQETGDVEFKISEIDPSDGAMIYSTSGSTGLPKGVLIPYKSIARRLTTTWGHYIDYGTKLKVPVFPNLHWISSMFYWAPSILFGATRIQTRQGLTPDIAMKLIANSDAKLLMLGSPLAMAIIKHPEFEKIELKNLDVLSIGGSDVSKALIDKLQEKLPNGFVKNVFAMTETIGPVADYKMEKDEPSLSLGTSLEGVESKIVDVNTRLELGPNESGELLLKCDDFFKEYYRDPVATKEAFENGWFKTGDMMYITEDGYLYFVERIKILLKYLNYQISPQELEGVISVLPGVQLVGITGIPVPGEGEYPVAFVVKREGFEISEDDIKKTVSDNLSSYKQLRGGVVFVDSLPLNSNGKIDRGKLKEMAAKKPA